MKISDRETVEMLLDESGPGIEVARAFWRDCYVAVLDGTYASTGEAHKHADRALVKAVSLGMIKGVEL